VLIDSVAPEETVMADPTLFNAREKIDPTSVRKSPLEFSTRTPADVGMVASSVAMLIMLD
jgi:hypothetical protein